MHLNEMALEQPYKRNICFFRHCIPSILMMVRFMVFILHYLIWLTYLILVCWIWFDIIYIFRVPDWYFSCSIETLMAEMECTFPRGCRLRSTAGVVMGLHILPITGQVTTAREEGMVLMITVPGNHTVSSWLL